MAWTHKHAQHHQGDILGISDADPNVKIPKPVRKGSGHATGLDTHQPTAGLDDVKPGHFGATGIDMGSGGEGTGIAEHSSRPEAAEDERGDKEP